MSGPWSRPFDTAVFRKGLEIPLPERLPLFGEKAAGNHADDGILEADKVAERTGQMREHMQQLRDSGLCPFPMGRPRHIHENPDSHS